MSDCSFFSLILSFKEKIIKTGGCLFHDQKAKERAHEVVHADLWAFSLFNEVEVKWQHMGVVIKENLSEEVV